MSTIFWTTILIQIQQWLTIVLLHTCHLVDVFKEQNTYHYYYLWFMGQLIMDHGFYSIDFQRLFSINIFFVLCLKKSNCCCAWAIEYEHWMYLCMSHRLLLLNYSSDEEEEIVSVKFRLSICGKQSFPLWFWFYCYKAILKV